MVCCETAQLLFMLPFLCVLARSARVPFFLLLHHLCEAQVVQQQEKL